MITDGGRALNGLGEREFYQTQSNSECHRVESGRQTVGAKVYRREEKSPDRQLRSLSYD